MQKKFKVIVKNLQYLNPVKQTCNHLMGKDHTQMHRIKAGVVYIFTGVFVSKLGGSGIAHFISDGVGYLIHAFGTIPFIEALQEHLKQEKNDISKEK